MHVCAHVYEYVCICTCICIHLYHLYVYERVHVRIIQGGWGEGCQGGREIWDRDYESLQLRQISNIGGAQCAQVAIQCRRTVQGGTLGKASMVAP